MLTRFFFANHPHPSHEFSRFWKSNNPTSPNLFHQDSSSPRVQNLAPPPEFSRFWISSDPPPLPGVKIYGRPLSVCAFGSGYSNLIFCLKIRFFECRKRGRKTTKTSFLPHYCATSHNGTLGSRKEQRIMISWTLRQWIFWLMRHFWRFHSFEKCLFGAH